MKKMVWGLVFILFSVVPGIALAKGAPLFYQTGDEIFEIEGAPVFEDGFSVGYVCQRFALFGADVWTWDCDLMAVSLEEFAAGELDEEYKKEMEAQFSLGDRKREPWNQYGVFIFVLVLIGFLLLKARGKKAAVA